MINQAGVLAATGFRVGAAHCGIKSAKGEPDVALIVADGPASAAGVFTTNKFAAAPVRWNCKRVPSANIRAVVVNSGNANSCTGERGAADVHATAELAGELIGCEPGQVCVASTGIIGHPLPMDKLREGIRQAHADLSAQPEAACQAARAIMTTDTRPKTFAVSSEIAGMPFRAGGMAKGAGMIAPHMATMLAFVTTDAIVPPDVLQQALRDAANTTLNCVTVDGDSSTNDTVLVLASGRSGAEVRSDGTGVEEFREALHAVLEALSMQLVADGEGATKVVDIRVTGALDQQDAECAARAVAESQLFKCAVHGGDPNWGRIVCALGYSGAQIEPSRSTVHIGEVCVLKRGEPTGDDAAEQMAGERVSVRIDLGLGSAAAGAWTCDLSEEYVRINAKYHT
jgi:glutamate N-acetyltransferase/amino-acid N-acetyltransferase